MSITFQKQGENECWLATVCMLADYPLPKIREEIVTQFGYSWVEMQQRRHQQGHVQRRSMVAEFVVERTGTDRNLLTINWAYGTTIRRGRAPKMKVPQGRGAMTIVRYRGTNYHNGYRYIHSHAIAFENGTIYDPGYGSLSEARFNELYHGWRIEEVIQVPVRINMDAVVARGLSARMREERR